jgi:metal-responsive CopG/Arc/MetJ family transcriptional regulator
MQTVESYRSSEPHDSTRSFVRVALDDELLRAIDNFRRKQPDIPSRAEALRQLAARSLTADCAAA